MSAIIKIMKNTNIYITVALAGLIAIGAFYAPWQNWLTTPTSRPTPQATSTPISTVGLPPLTFENFAGTPVAIQIWSTFEAYRAAATAHDLEKVKSLSYQVSPACQDPERRAECDTLMDSVAFFTADFKQSDFGHIAYDTRQAILSTDYLKLEGADEPIKTVLYFVREGEIAKMLGIRFCIGVEDERQECVETSRDKRDQNNNGWWDDVEALFR